MLIDTHAHLNDERLAPLNDEIIKNMKSDGIAAIINVAYNYNSSVASVELANKNKDIYAAVGIHPHDAKSADNCAYDYFTRVAKNEKVVAIGEIGLDYHYNYSPEHTQIKVFVEQLELANSLNMPVVIHLRDAYEDMYNLLKDNRNKLRNGFMLHCYSGSAEMAERYNEFGPYYSFGGVITFSNKEKVVKSIPRDRLLLETDCPYMTPVPMRGRLNIPAYIEYVADKMAEILGKTSEEIAEITSVNAARLFGRLQ